MSTAPPASTTANHMTHTITIDEEQRQLTLLALAELSLRRPGWDHALRELARRYPGGEAMYDSFRSTSSDQVAEEAGMRALLEQAHHDVRYLIERERAGERIDAATLAMVLRNTGK